MASGSTKLAGVDFANSTSDQAISLVIVIEDNQLSGRVFNFVNRAVDQQPQCFGHESIKQKTPNQL